MAAALVWPSRQAEVGAGAARLGRPRTLAHGGRAGTAVWVGGPACEHDSVEVVVVDVGVAMYNLSLNSSTASLLRIHTYHRYHGKS